MVKNKFSWFAYTIIGLGLIGFISQLVTDPLGLFKSLFFILAISLLIFGLFYFLFFRNRYTSDEMKKYQQAVKQSKERYQKNKNLKRPTLYAKNPIRNKRSSKRRKAPHLRVIHGKKSKKRNRANF